MAHIENRSRIQVKVKNRDDLTRLFAHNHAEAAQRYCATLRDQQLKPLVALLDEAYMVRYYVHGKRKGFTATSAVEAEAIQKRIEADQYNGLFVDYTQAHQTSFADLLIRYLKEEAPRKKGFAVIGYQINMWLEDAGYERQDLAAIHAAHPNPQDRSLRIPKPTGRRMSHPSEAAVFIKTSFAALGPEDFREYMDERLQCVEPATVDRELDVFRAVCNTAMSAWRIHVHMDPMSGLERPKYFNERDRRLRDGEEARLMAAAHEEDHLWTERALGDQLFEEQGSTTKYQRLKAKAEARTMVSNEARHVPMFATFIQFQLMTAARRSETLKLKWNQVDLDRQTAFLPETKNGRPRTLPLRADLVALLRELPQTGEYVFPIPVDYLRKAWLRMCEAGGIETLGSERLRIHDLRHEAISRVAEAGSQTPGGFSLLDLQAFSGHRDPRMLLRYTHLTPTGLAKRLDAAFSASGLKYGKAVNYHGRTRLTKQAELPMSELMSAPITTAIDDNDNHKVVDFQAYRKATA